MGPGNSGPECLGLCRRFNASPVFSFRPAKRAPCTGHPICVESSFMKRSRPAGLTAILAWKCGKGAIELAAALFLLILVCPGDGQYLEEALDFMQHHFVRAWSSRLAGLLLADATWSHVRLLCLALGLDGSATLTEWWCLWRGYSWGEWFVAASAGSLLPFEVYELLEGVRLGRVVVFAVNSLIVLYLVWRNIRKRPMQTDMP